MEIREEHKKMMNDLGDREHSAEQALRIAIEEHNRAQNMVNAEMREWWELIYSEYDLSREYCYSYNARFGKIEVKE